MAKKGYTHKITPIKSNKAIKIFEKLGFKQVSSAGGGSHIVFKKNPDDIDFLVLVKHGSNPIAPNAIKRMLKNGKITEKQYLDAFNSI
ncbi:MAG: type II toxin-antitoxin system HicA family toxin [Gammaproteobacteria bacterium]|nr:type II toxin-antitoxin system HicA family toxin [Gammaproteobacteria bacterium]